MDYFSRPALLIFYSGPQAHPVCPRCYLYCLRHLQIDDRNGMALQRHPNGLLFFLPFFMYFKEDKEEKESGKDKDQTNKNALKINDGVAAFCSGETPHCGATSTHLRGQLILTLKLASWTAPTHHVTQKLEVCYTNCYYKYHT